MHKRKHKQADDEINIISPYSISKEEEWLMFGIGFHVIELYLSDSSLACKAINAYLAVYAMLNSHRMNNLKE